MIGYHFTDGRHWPEILQSGLRGSNMWKRHPAIARELEAAKLSTTCVWLWPTLPTGLDLLGTILDRLGTFSTTNVIVIEASVPDKEMLNGRIPFKNGSYANLIHTGGMGHDSHGRQWNYHQDKPFMLALKTIPLNRLKLIKQYDLIKLMEDA